MIEVENHSDLPLAGVRSVVRWVFEYMGIEQAGIVRVFHTEHWWHHGHFYATKPFLVLAHVPEQITGVGHDRGLRGGPPPVFPADWREALVCILAHEGTHVRQFFAGQRTPNYTQRRKGKIVHVRGRTFSEVEAEWAEYRLLKRWRERRK
jgi:hypothetical protein